MVATGAGIDSRSSAKLAPHCNSCVVQHSAVVEILNQRGDALVELAAMITDKIKVLAMTVPATVRHRDRSNASFDKTPSHQHVTVHGRSTVVLILVRLAVAVLRDKSRVFLADVQSVEQFVGSQNSEGRLVKRVHAFEQPAGIRFSLQHVEAAEQRLSILQPVERHSVQLEIRQAVAVRLKRGVSCSEKSRTARF